MFKFTPKINEKVKKLLNDKELLYSIMDYLESPCNIIFPEIIDNNVYKFKEIYKKHNLNGKIFFAHKCNKSSSIVKQILKNDINIDVASLNELKSALSNGFTGDKIEATGPKNDDFIVLGLRHNVIFNVDSLNELETICFYHKKMDSKNKIKVLIRLNDFSSSEMKIINKSSRFGTSTKYVFDLIDYVCENGDIFNLIGLSFHVDTVNINEKVLAIENCIEIFEEMFEMGLNPHVLNIGGGFKVNYIENKDEWNENITKLKEDILSGNNNLSWNNASFGLRTEKGVLKGALNIYNYYDEIVGEKFLDELLCTRLTKFENRKIGEILSENMIDLYIEPGRSLLDGVGINISRVNFVKKNEKDELLVGLDMKRSDLLIGEQEMFVDPIIVSKNEITNSDANSVYFVGNLCMENDIIYKHKVFTNITPKKDDLVIFINTAGYFMDFEQSNTIMQKIANKLIATYQNNKIKFFMDDTYEPLKIDKGGSN